MYKRKDTINVQEKRHNLRTRERHNLRTREKT